MRGLFPLTSAANGTFSITAFEKNVLEGGVLEIFMAGGLRNFSYHVQDDICPFPHSCAGGIMCYVCPWAFFEKMGSPHFKRLFLLSPLSISDLL
ncbi:hypothetical protein CDAR_515061 [Caerostris darwini]|uniref:Uncharacterized protein n=1 Tax=Caerostris darwini TaxID=1538125 RepID=A0AAV4W097_9ARAC|nr:hypothetical protein CDAR_515061 [Caerostris darwini]